MKMTPRKVQALLLVHYEVERQKFGGKSTQQNSASDVNGYIDTIPGW